MRFFKEVNRLLCVVGGLGLLVMMTIAVVNIAGREFFGFAVMATIEVVELSCVILASLALAYTHARRGNIIINILVDRLPERTRAIFDSVTLSLSALIVIALCWTGALYALGSASEGEVTPIIIAPMAPFRFVWVAGCAFLFVAVLAHVIEVARKAAKR